MVQFIASGLPEGGVDAPAISLARMPRECPCCRQRTIVGHGLRRKQAHDDLHDRIWVRRGRCRPCHKTFTFLPAGSLPYTHYSLRRRAQWMQSSTPPPLKSSTRIEDPSTIRRWMARRWVSLVSWARILLREGNGP
jgi:transposase-like protein